MRHLLTSALLLAACGGDVIPVGRRDYTYVSTTCRGGINQTAEEASPEQCEEALNVWAVDGRVETRPGYEGIIDLVNPGSINALSTVTVEGYDSSAASYTGGTLSSLKARTASDGDFVYLGSDVLTDNISVQVGATNSNATRFQAEYWNGSEWLYLSVIELGINGTSDASVRKSYFASSSPGNAEFFSFARPQDWAQRSINGTTAYWLKLHLLDADIDAGCTLSAVGAYNGLNVRGLFAAQFPTQKAYISLSLWGGNRGVVDNAAAITLDGNKRYEPVTFPSILAEPATLAVVPQFVEAFAAYDNKVVRSTPGATSADATVEDRDFAVGSGAPNDKDVYPQLAEFPRAKYIQFFKGRLWAAGLLGEPYTVRWSQAQPYHKVWRQLQFEVLAENDNSPITGMYPLGEYMVIFKQDSIWMAYDAGLDAFGGYTYTIRQVVNGVGCVSQNSIKAIRGNLIFLAEDGLYRFDGSSVNKVSIDKTTGADRLKDLWATISPGRRPFAAAAHWKTNSVYLLSFSTTGTTNDYTLVWDYDSDAFWHWDNIDAQHWLEDEGQFDEETLFFGDSEGRIYRMGGQTDHMAPIEIELTTARIGMNSNTKLRLRSVEVATTNKARSVGVEALPNDAETGSSGTLTTTDDAEADWSSFSYASGAATDDNWTTERRRIRRLAFRTDCDSIQIKLTHSEQYQKFALTSLTLGMLALGMR